MKYSILILFTFIFLGNSNAQNVKNNIKIGSNMYSFTNSGIDILNEFSFAYTRKLSPQKWSIEIGSSFFYKYYTLNRTIVLGDVFDRYFFSFEANSIFHLYDRNKSQFNIVFGPSYRIGSENQVVNIIEHTIWTDVVINEEKYTSFGLTSGIEYQYFMTNKWNFSLAVGYQYFFKKSIKNTDVYSGIMFGYGF